MLHQKIKTKKITEGEKPSEVLRKKIGNLSTKEYLERKKEMIKPHVEPLLFSEQIKEIKMNIMIKLLAMLESLAESLTDFNIFHTSKKKIRILSLGSGVCDEYFVLKEMFKDKQVEYVALDIDVTLNEEIAKYHANEKDFYVINCNASNIYAVYHALQQLNLAKSFDLVILRQPNIIHLENIFKAMIEQVIPFVTASNANFFISTYHPEEMKKVKEILFHQPNIRYVTPALNFTVNQKIFFDEGSLEPDSFAALGTINGRNFQLTQKENYLIEIYRITSRDWVSQFLSWKYAEQKNILWANCDEKEILDEIVNYLHQFEKVSESILVGKTQNPNEFCIKIVAPNLKMLQQIPPLVSTLSWDVQQKNIEDDKKLLIKNLIQLSLYNMQNKNPDHKKDLAKEHKHQFDVKYK